MVALLFDCSESCGEDETRSAPRPQFSTNPVSDKSQRQRIGEVLTFLERLLCGRPALRLPYELWARRDSAITEQLLLLAGRSCSKLEYPFVGGDRAPRCYIKAESKAEHPVPG